MASTLLGRSQGVIDNLNNANSIAATLDPLLNKIKMFTDIVDGIAEVGCAANSRPFLLILSRFTLTQRWLGAYYPQHTKCVSSALL